MLWNINRQGLQHVISRMVYELPKENYNGKQEWDLFKNEQCKKNENWKLIWILEVYNHHVNLYIKNIPKKNSVDNIFVEMSN